MHLAARSTDPTTTIVRDLARTFGWATLVDVARLRPTGYDYKAPHFLSVEGAPVVLQRVLDRQIAKYGVVQVGKWNANGLRHHRDAFLNCARVAAERHSRTPMSLIVANVDGLTTQAQQIREAHRPNWLGSNTSTPSRSSLV